MRNFIVILSLSTALMACGGSRSGKKADAPENNHVHGVQQLTMFTDSLEFFVEFPELMAGHESEVHVHLTRIPAYKPCPAGRVNITLDFGDTQSDAYSDSPVTPGIWKVPLVPEFSGKCRIIFEYVENGYIEKFVFTGGKVSEHVHETRNISGKQPENPSQADGGDARSHDDESSEHPHKEDGHSHDDNTAHPHDDMSAEMVIVGTPDGMRFTKEQAWKADFSVNIIEPQPFSGIIRAGGEILAMPGEKYFIHARNSGIVNYSKKGLVAGGYIEEGEEMMRIEGQDIAHDNIMVEFAEAESRFLKSRSEYLRRYNLIRENAISEKEFIKTRAAYISDSIIYYNLRQSYADGGLRITSPISGYLHELKVSQGEFVRAGQLIATVSSDLRLLLRADVPQHHFSRIEDIVSTNFRTSYHENVFDIADFKGSLLAVGSSVKENNQYLPVYFEAHNNGELLEGAYAEFFLKMSPLQNSITVPVEAILEEQGKYYVFVQVAGETYQKREIRPGETDGIRYHVIGGLFPGERVVTRGSMLLKAASMSTSLPGDSHQH